MKRVFCLFALLIGIGVNAPAVAHPHVFVDARTGFRFDTAGRLTSLRITWTYDAFTSLTLFDILDLDKDGDGYLDDADRAAIVRGETDWPEGYKGDTYLDMNGTDVPLARPLNGEAWLAEDRVTVTFDLPLQAPLEPRGEVTLRLYDPIYYYAYTVVGLDGDLPAGCSAEIDPFKPDAATATLRRQLAALSREETPDQENVGLLFADRILLTCN